MIAAPASAAPIAASAISSGVIGRCGDIVGVWIAPVTAQVMMTLRFAMSVSLLVAYNSARAGDPTRSRPRLRSLMGAQRRQPPVTPARAGIEARTVRGLAPFAQDRLHVRRLIHVGAGGRRLQAAVEAGVARAIVGHAARRIEVDGLERPHERPAQAEPVLDRLVEVLRRDATFA